MSKLPKSTPTFPGPTLLDDLSAAALIKPTSRLGRPGLGVAQPSEPQRRRISPDQALRQRGISPSPRWDQVLTVIGAAWRTIEEWAPIIEKFVQRDVSSPRRKK